MPLPAAHVAYLNTWGPSLCSRLQSCWSEFMRGAGEGWLSSGPMVPGQFVVGTDCSGAEAPIWALRSCGLPRRHVFSCDKAPGPRSFIAANTPPEGCVFIDMIGRDHAVLPDMTHYVAGFPCKAFSMLRGHSTRLMREPTAKPFYAVLAVLRAKQPRVAVLENVTGIKRVMPTVLRSLRALKIYHVFVQDMCPTDFGEPVKRPRVYFLLVRKDRARAADERMLQDALDRMWQACRSTKMAGLADRCLPATHPEVLRFQEVERARMVKAKAAGFPVKPGSKWQARRRLFQMNLKKSGGGAKGLGTGPSADDLLLANAREREQWALLAQVKRLASSGPAVQVQRSNNFVADLSQNIDRCSYRFDGLLPTLTPHANIAVSALRRRIIPVEKLLLHGFPIHKIKFPASISDHDIASLGGNTMDLRCIAAALLLATSLVIWSPTAVLRSAAVSQPPAVSPPPELPPQQRTRADHCRPARGPSARSYTTPNCAKIFPRVLTEAPQFTMNTK